MGSGGNARQQTRVLYELHGDKGASSHNGTSAAAAQAWRFPTTANSQTWTRFSVAGFEGCLQPIYAAIREALSVPPAARAAARPRPATCPEALQCVGMLAVALGPLWRPYAAALIESCVLTGVSEVLVAALTQVRVGVGVGRMRLSVAAAQACGLGPVRPQKPYQCAGCCLRSSGM